MALSFTGYDRHTGIREIAVDNKRDISQNFTKLLRRKDNMEWSNIAVDFLNVKVPILFKETG
jgi:hypothetical protein